MENKIHKELPSGIRYIGKTEKCFPKKLLELQDCPQGIYVRGKLPDPKKKTVAIVGARMCSAPQFLLFRNCFRIFYKFPILPIFIFRSLAES